MAWTDLKEAVASVIKTNGNKEITGLLLHQVLDSIVDNVGGNWSYKGVASVVTTPGTPDGNDFYIAFAKGVYANFGGLRIDDNDAYVFKNSGGNWTKESLGVAYAMEPLTNEMLYISKRSNINMFNPFTVLLGYNLDANMTGNLIANALWFTSDFIDAKLNDNYSFNKGGIINYYDVNKSFISGEVLTGGATLATIPLSAVWMRFSLLKTDIPSIQVEPGNIVTPYKLFASINSAAILQKSIPMDRLVESDSTVNLYNKLKSEQNKYISFPTDGSIQSYPGWFVSELIPVKPDTNYTTNNSVVRAWYNIDGVLISYSSNTAKTVTSPSNARFIRISATINDLMNSLQLEEGNSSTAYKEYHRLDSSSIKGVVSERIPGIRKSINLFDKRFITTGKYVNIANGGLVSNALWFSSEFIPITPNTPYTGLGFCAFYGPSMNFISGGLVGGGTKFLTSPAGSSYLRMSQTITDLNVTQVSIGKEPVAYEPFGYVVDESRIITPESPITTTELVVKTGGTVGVDCDFTNIKSAMDSIIDNSYTNRYIVRVMNGTYDVSTDGFNYLGLKNYVDIIGQTKSGVKVIKRPATFSSVFATFDTAFYHDSIEYASLRNMTIISFNGKGPVHVDSGYEDLISGGTLEIIDCDLIHENTPEMVHYQNGLACGLRDGQRVVARNVNSNGQLWVHNSAPAFPNSGCTLELYNCRFPHTEIADIYCYGRDKFIMHNCKANYIKFTLSDPYSQKRSYTQFSWDVDLKNNEIGYILGQLYHDPTPNESFWNVAFGGKFGIQDSSIHMFCKNNTAAQIPPYLVALDTNYSEVSVKEWEPGDKVFGISLDTIPAGGFGTIQYDGVLTLWANGSTTINVNDPLELNTSGEVVKQTTGVLVGHALESTSSVHVPLKVKFIRL